MIWTNKIEVSAVVSDSAVGVMSLVKDLHGQSLNLSNHLPFKKNHCETPALVSITLDVQLTV